MKRKKMQKQKIGIQWKEKDPVVFLFISFISFLVMIYFYWVSYFDVNLLYTESFNFKYAEISFICMGIGSVGLVLFCISKKS